MTACLDAGQILNSCQNCLSLGSLKPRSLPLGGMTAPGEKATNGAQSFQGRQTSHASKRLSLLLRMLASFWCVHAALPPRSGVLNPVDAGVSAATPPVTSPAGHAHNNPYCQTASSFCVAAESLISHLSSPVHRLTTRLPHIKITLNCRNPFLNNHLSTHFLCQDLLIKQYHLQGFATFICSLCCENLWKQIIWITQMF